MWSTTQRGLTEGGWKHRHRRPLRMFRNVNITPPPPPPPSPPGLLHCAIPITDIEITMATEFLPKRKPVGKLEERNREDGEREKDKDSLGLAQHAMICEGIFSTCSLYTVRGKSMISHSASTFIISPCHPVFHQASLLSKITEPPAVFPKLSCLFANSPQSIHFTEEGLLLRVTRRKNSGPKDFNNKYLFILIIDVLL